mmetsp:Transcript_44839/g.97518  ORF Transcript_44839/g.97518 Transcript_44839/m.97518 type:complete len:150 (-) Transcript_44839:325-774(-)
MTSCMLMFMLILRVCLCQVASSAETAHAPHACEQGRHACACLLPGSVGPAAASKPSRSIRMLHNSSRQQLLHQRTEKIGGGPYPAEDCSTALWPHGREGAATVATASAGSALRGEYIARRLSRLLGTPSLGFLVCVTSTAALAFSCSNG